MQNYQVAFTGVSCKGCVTAIEQKLSSYDRISLEDIDRNTGNSIIKSDLNKENIHEMIQEFPGCCSNCQINLKSIDALNGENSGFKDYPADENHLIKIQYKQALERMKAREEVACNEYCVCKTTTVNRFEEFSDAPSFSSIFNLSNYLQELDILKPGLEIIDFGSGTGHDTFQIAPLIFPGHIIGIDVTEEMVDYAKQIAIKLGIQNTTFKRSDSLQIISENSKDVVITNNVFNILIHKEKFIMEADRILKTGGYLVIADEFIIDNIPEKLRNDPAFQCGGIAGAKSTKDVKALVERGNFKTVIEKRIRAYNITYDSNVYNLESKILVFSKKSK